uniref:Uncharacterized protein n=1 Tax=Conchiformibius kuhniae TaxID=211502 RepID=A0A8T9MYU5_9NEIS|nr:hypothetical protein LVJ77_03970 [Conchiformibius kuhniae]
MERSHGAGCAGTAWADAFPTLLAGLRGGTSIDLSFGNVIAVPDSRHQMVERQRKTEADGFLRGLAQTDFEEARAAGNAVVPQVAQWIAQKLIKTF